MSSSCSGKTGDYPFVSQREANSLILSLARHASNASPDSIMFAKIARCSLSL
jgi:hypothetical protein